MSAVYSNLNLAVAVFLHQAAEMLAVSSTFNLCVAIVIGTALVCRVILGLAAAVYRVVLGLAAAVYRVTRGLSNKVIAGPSRGKEQSAPHTESKQEPNARDGVAGALSPFPWKETQNAFFTLPTEKHDVCFATPLEPPSLGGCKAKTVRWE